MSYITIKLPNKLYQHNLNPYRVKVMLIDHYKIISQEIMASPFGLVYT